MDFVFWSLCLWRCYSCVVLFVLYRLNVRCFVDFLSDLFGLELCCTLSTYAELIDCYVVPCLLLSCDLLRLVDESWYCAVTSYVVWVLSGACGCHAAV